MTPFGEESKPRPEILLGEILRLDPWQENQESHQKVHADDDLGRKGKEMTPTKPQRVSRSLARGVQEINQVRSNLPEHQTRLQSCGVVIWRCTRVVKTAFVNDGSVCCKRTVKCAEDGETAKKTIMMRSERRTKEW